MPNMALTSRTKRKTKYLADRFAALYIYIRIYIHTSAQVASCCFRSPGPITEGSETIEDKRSESRKTCLCCTCDSKWIPKIPKVTQSKSLCASIDASDPSESSISPDSSSVESADASDQLNSADASDPSWIKLQSRFKGTWTSKSLRSTLNLLMG